LGAQMYIREGRDQAVKTEERRRGHIATNESGEDSPRKREKYKKAQKVQDGTGERTAASKGSRAKAGKTREREKKARVKQATNYRIERT